MREDKWMYQKLYDEATQAPVLSRQIIDTLLNSMEYSSISFINWSVEVLQVIKIRLDRGDKITDEVSKEVYTVKSFQEFVKKNFSSYIYSQVYAPAKDKEKIYFRLSPCEGGYNLVMAKSNDDKVYEWISSLNTRFALVRMIATGVVYVKDTKSCTYRPFISENGKYCRYEMNEGKITEIN